MNMPKKKSGVVAEKARNLLRLASLWAKKVAVFKRGIKVKGLGDNKAPTDQIRYLERQLSFDRTPDFHVKKDRRLKGSMWFLLPCVGAKAVEFDYDNIAADEESYLTEEEEGREEEEEEECNGCEKKSQYSEEEGIDSRAEKFIAEFYGQIMFRK